MLENLKKEELQAEYKRLTGQEAKTAWSKAELIEEIEKFNAGEKGNQPPGNQDGKKDDNNPPAPPAEGEKKEEVKEGEFIIVKKNANGEVIDRQTTNRDIWNNLPEGKLGWERETPNEVV